MEMKLKPIGIIHSPFQQAAGTPIQPAAAGQAEGRIEVFPDYQAALADLEGFERIWLLYWFDRAVAPKLQVKPFLDDHPRGLFATRAPCRPNPIGISCVEVKKIEANIITVSGIDVLDRTPLLDIKPYVPPFDCFAVQKYGWLQDKQVSGQTADRRFSGKEEKA